VSTEADELVRRFILGKYREERAIRTHSGRAHLLACPEVEVADPEAYDSTYGCDTGCEYVRFEATIRCPHGYSEEYEWGDFDDIASILPRLDELRKADG
jgi:hypothetical protein